MVGAFLVCLRLESGIFRWFKIQNTLIIHKKKVLNICMYVSNYIETK